MPRVPVYEQRVETAPVARPNVSAAPDADALGAPIAEGAARLGGGVGRGLTAAADDIGREIQRVNKAQVDGALVALAQGEYEDFYEPQKGMLAKRKGKEASGLTLDGVARWDKRAADVEKSLGTDSQRQEFKRQAAERRVNVERNLAHHENNEREAAFDAAEQGALATSTSDAVRGWQDSTGEIPRKAREWNRQTAKDRAKRLGLGDPDKDDAAKTYVRQEVSKLHLSVLNAMTDAAKTDPGAALAAKNYLRDFRTDIDGKMLADSNMEAIVGGITTKAQGVNEGTRIWLSAGDDPKKHLDELNKIQDEGVRNVASHFLKSRLDEIENARETIDKKFLPTVQLQIEKSNGWLDQSAKEFQAMTDNGKRQAMALARNIRENQLRSRTTEGRRDIDLKNKEALTDFARLEDNVQLSFETDAQLKAAYPGVDQVTLNQMMKIRKDTQEQKDKSRQVPRSAIIDMVRGKLPGAKKKDIEQLEAEMIGWRSNLEVDPTKEQVREELDRQIRDWVIERPFFIPDVKEPYYKMTPEMRKAAKPLGGAKLSDEPAPAPTVPRVPPPNNLEEVSVPAPERTLIIEALKKNGRAVSEENIRRAYELRKSRETK